MEASPSLGRRIAWGLVAGLIVGAALRLGFGQEPWLAGLVGNVLLPVGRVFLRLIFMVTVPLIVASLLLGVVELRGVGRLGRIGARTLLLTALLATTAVVIGLLLVNVARPGSGLDAATREALLAAHAGEAAAKGELLARRSSFVDSLLQLIPTNPLAEAVHAFDPQHGGGGLLAVMVGTLIAGVAMTRLPEERVAPLVAVLESVNAVAMKVIDFAMFLAPVGVACLLASMVATTGWAVIRSLGLFVAVALGGLLLHAVVTYGLVLRVLARRSWLGFVRGAAEALITAFSTSSSNASLPVSLRVAEQGLGLRPATARFVLTVGATGNQNGTALFEGVTVLFLAQVFARDLGLAGQLQVAVAASLAGIGTAGVPGGSIPLIMGVLASVGVPPEGIAIVLGVDRLLDMSRTVVNVMGDLVIACVVDRTEPVPEAA